MRDLISRQAAIDATWEEPTYTDPLNVLTEVRDRIKELPSAQPDVPDTNDGDLISREAMGEALNRIRVSKNETWYSFYQSVLNELCKLPSAQPEVIRCKDCKWWDKYNEKHGYCMAAKHGFMSSHWEISIYRKYDEDFFCADAEPKEKEGGDDEAD